MLGDEDALSADVEGAGGGARLVCAARIFARKAGTPARSGAGRGGGSAMCLLQLLLLLSYESEV